MLAKDKAFYIFTSGTTGHAEGQRHDALPVAAGAGRRSVASGMRLTSDDTLDRRLPLYHNNALTVALSSVLNSGATLALGKSFSCRSLGWETSQSNT